MKTAILVIAASAAFLTACVYAAFGIGVSQAHLEKRALCEQLVREQVMAGWSMDNYFCRTL